MGPGYIVIQVMLILSVFVVLYLALVRPQQLRLKRHQAMLSSLRSGDRVATSGGLVGTIVSVENDHSVTLEIAEGTRVTIIRRAIDEVLAKDGERNAVAPNTELRSSAA